MDGLIAAMVDRYGWSISLTVAAEITGISDDTLRKLAKAGRFPAHTAGRRWESFLPDVVEWMRAGGEGQYAPEPAKRPRPRRPRGELRGMAAALAAA